jgi:non-ribosomal peptide synthetase component F
VAIWAANVPEWFFAEFGAALAGLTLVTVNPAYLAAELAHVLKQSRACGVIVQDHYRGRDLLAAVTAARETLPLLREVIPLSAWREFAASGAREIALPTVLPGDVAQIQYTSGTTGAPQRRKAHASGSRQQQPVLCPDGWRARNRYVGEPDADVPHRGMQPLHARLVADRRGAGYAARFRCRADARPS